MLGARAQVMLSRLLSQGHKVLFTELQVGQGAKIRNGTLNFVARKTHQVSSGWVWVSERTGDTMPFILLLAVTIRDILNLGVLVCCLGQGERQPIYLQSDERTEGSLTD